MREKERERVRETKRKRETERERQRDRERGRLSDRHVNRLVCMLGINFAAMFWFLCLNM